MCGLKIKHRILSTGRQGCKVEEGGRKGLDGSGVGNGALSLTSLNSVHWISAVIMVERGRRYESISRPCKPTCAGRKGKKPKRTLIIVCPVLLTQPQESSVYSRGLGPGPEMEPGDAAD